ncbi:MAG: NUDIX hydrolase [Candidatus Bathyarchaeota archaeon]|nr:NUDIX hydrolase [Candidatus Bathyarchaeota archaeon]
MKKRPIVASSALVEKNGKILLVKRRFQPHPGWWALPGGVVEYGETVEETAIREIKEETGLNIEVKKLLGVYDLMVKNEFSGEIEKQYTIVCFVCECKSGEEKLKPNYEVLDVRWFNPEDAKKLQLVSTTRRALEDAGYI